MKPIDDRFTLVDFVTRPADLRWLVRKVHQLVNMQYLTDGGEIRRARFSEKGPDSILELSGQPTAIGVQIAPPAMCLRASGGTETESGGYLFHTFTTAGSFVVTRPGPATVTIAGTGSIDGVTAGNNIAHTFAAGTFPVVVGTTYPGYININYTGPIADSPHTYHLTGQLTLQSVDVGAGTAIYLVGGLSATENGSPVSVRGVMFAYPALSNGDLVTLTLGLPFSFEVQVNYIYWHGTLAWMETAAVIVRHVPCDDTPSGLLGDTTIPDPNAPENAEPSDFDLISTDRNTGDVSVDRTTGNVSMARA